MDRGVLSGGWGAAEVADAVVREETLMVRAWTGGWTEVDRSELCFGSRTSALATRDVEVSGKGRSGFGLGVGLKQGVQSR